MLDVSRQAVTKWEANQTTPSSDNLIALAKLYEVSLDELIGRESETNVDEEKKNLYSPKHNPILRANLIKIAIMAQAIFLNTAVQPIYMAEDTPYHFAFLLLFKILPLVLVSIWMAINLRYEKDEKQFKKNTRIELLYCIVMAGITLTGYYTKWYFPTSVALITVCLIYILVINPKYMNRQLTKQKEDS